MRGTTKLSREFYNFLNSDFNISVIFVNVFSNLCRETGDGLGEANNDFFFVGKC